MTGAPSGEVADSIRWRLPYFAALAAASGALLVGRYLQPSPRGVGTHEQLGLPACFFLKFTGLPCPSCGVTTSFSYAAHLQFREALTAQPFGFVLFVLICLSMPLFVYAIYRQVPFDRWLYTRWSNPLLYALIALYLIGWVYKLAVFARF